MIIKQINANSVHVELKCAECQALAAAIVAGTPGRQSEIVFEWQESTSTALRLAGYLAEQLFNNPRTPAPITF